MFLKNACMYAHTLLGAVISDCQVLPRQKCHITGTIKPSCSSNWHMLPEFLFVRGHWGDQDVDGRIILR